MKKTVIVVIMIMLILLVACVQEQTTAPETGLPKVVALSELGGHYTAEDYTDYGLWLVTIEAQALTVRVADSEAYYLETGTGVYTVQRNPLNAGQLMAFLPERFAIEGLSAARITTEQIGQAGSREDNSDIFIESVYLTKDGKEYEMTMVDYLFMKTASEAHDVNGAFTFLKKLPNNEELMYTGNPYKVAIEDGVVVTEAPDGRDRVWQLGTMGTLESGSENTYDIADDSGAQTLTLTIKENTLPVKYYRSGNYKIQLNDDATVCSLVSAGNDQYACVIEYAVTRNVDLVKNARFIDIVPSTQTAICVKEEKEVYAQVITEGATVLKTVSGTTVAQLKKYIEATDGSTQTYAFETEEGPLTDSSVLTKAGTLTVTAEFGAPYTAQFELRVNPTPFVRLEESVSPISGRKVTRDGNDTAVSWYDTIGEAVTASSETAPSTITVWPGTYRENIELGAKEIHLKSTDPSSQTIRETTIIDAGFNHKDGINIEGPGTEPMPSSSSEIKTIIEGFTITKQGGDINHCPAAIVVLNKSAIIRNNLITKNGTITDDLDSHGITVYQCPFVEIYDNTISENYAGNNVGSGIRVLLSTVRIHDNLINSNTYAARLGYSFAAGILVGRGEKPTSDCATATIYNNTITNNTIGGSSDIDGAGIYVNQWSQVFNKNGEEWRRFNTPNATVSFVEHNGDDADDNRYGGNTIEGGKTEGRDIFFEGIEQTPSGTLKLSPATATGDAGEKITLMATYTFTGFTYEGSVTFTLPSDLMVTTDASISINGEKRSLEAQEISDTGHVVTIKGIETTGSGTIVLTFNHSTGLGQGDYELTAAVDADGDGTRYTCSEWSTAALAIPPQYAAPTVSLVSPVSMELPATTTVTFSWNAWPGILSNTVARETPGIAGYVVAWATDTSWSSVTIDDAIAKQYATDTLHYGQDYKWYVKAIGNNGKTTTEEATFNTTYRLRDLGAEGTAYKIESAFGAYIVSVYKAALPERFKDITEFQLVVNGEKYKLAPNEEAGVIVYKKTFISSEWGELLDGFFGEKTTGPVSFVQGSEQGEYDTIKEAVAAIDKTSSDSVTLTLNEALYYEGEEIGLINCQAPVTIEAAEGITPVIYGQNRHRLFNIEESNKVTFKGVTFKNGFKDSATSSARGAAITCRETDLTVQGCTFRDNTVKGEKMAIFSTDGGAMHFYGTYQAPSNTLLISDCVFDSNQITGEAASSGGAIDIEYVNSARIENSTITSNTMGRGYGAGLSIKTVNSMTIENCAISSNDNGTDGDAGGVYINKSTVTIKNTTISQNTAAENAGGISVSYKSAVTFENVTVTGNTAGENGGGIYIKANSETTFENVTVTGNMAGEKGGGIYSDSTSELTSVSGANNVELTSGSVTNNTAGTYGGGIFIYDTFIKTNDHRWINTSPDLLLSGSDTPFYVVSDPDNGRNVYFGTKEDAPVQVRGNSLTDQAESYSIEFFDDPAW